MSSRIHIMDTEGAGTFVRTLSKADGLTVIFSEEEDAQPCTDAENKIIYVAKPRWYWDDEQYNCWLGAICHELGHHRGKNADIMRYFTLKKLNTQSMYGKVINILMDWVDDFQWKDYPGAHQAVQAVQVRCAVKGAAFLKTNPPSDEKDILLCKLFSWIYKRRSVTYQIGLTLAAEQWNSLIPHDLDKYNSDLLELLRLQTPESIEILARKIVPESAEDEQQQQGEGEGEGEEGDSESSEEQTEAEKKDGSTEPETISYKDILISHDHFNTGKSSKTKIVYDHNWTHSYIPIGKFREINLENT